MKIGTHCPWYVGISMLSLEHLELSWIVIIIIDLTYVSYTMFFFVTMKISFKILIQRSGSSKFVEKIRKPSPLCTEQGHQSYWSFDHALWSHHRRKNTHFEILSTLFHDFSLFWSNIFVLALLKSRSKPIAIGTRIRQCAAVIRGVKWCPKFGINSCKHAKKWRERKNFSYLSCCRKRFDGTE